MKRYKLNYLALFLLFILVLPLAACGQSNSTSPKIQPATSQGDSSAYPITITNYDTMENTVDYTYTKAPARVVLTHPGATELLLELGLEDRILSTVAPYGAPLDRVAEKYTKLTIMKAQYDPSQEELLEMQPDLIISWVHQFASTALGNVKTWHDRKIGTFIMPSTLTKTKPTLENVVYACISDIGKIFNIQDKTIPYIQSLKDRVAKVEAAVKNLPQRKTVLVVQDHFNGTFSLYDSHYLISNMIDIAGGKNLCQDPVSFVGAEKVLAFDPDFIIVVSLNKNDSTKDLTDGEAIKNLQEVKELRSMRAIQQGNIINLPFFTVNNGGVRTVDAIEKISRQLYPELY